MDKEDYYAFIEKKIDGTLTNEERIVFDYQLQTDPEFAKAYTLQTSVVRHFKKHHRNELRNTLEAGYQAAKRKQARRRLYWYGAVAATVVVIIAVGTYWFNRASLSDTLYEAYYRPFRVGPLLRSSQSAEPLGTQFYKQQNYTAALMPLQRQLVQKLSNSDTLHLMIGNSYLQVDSLAKAISHFNLVADSLMLDHKQWYLALAYIKEDKYDQAKPLLKKLALRGYYRQKARSMLSTLK